MKANKAAISKKKHFAAHLNYNEIQIDKSLGHIYCTKRTIKNDDIYFHQFSSNANNMHVIKHYSSKSQNSKLVAITLSSRAIAKQHYDISPSNNMSSRTSVHFGSLKKRLIDGIISGLLLQTNFLRLYSAYVCPSA